MEIKNRRIEEGLLYTLAVPKVGVLLYTLKSRFKQKQNGNPPRNTDRLKLIVYAIK